MPGLTLHTGTLAVYRADNVDTDRIIPARFLTLVSRSGYGDLLFKDVRGPKFPLDQPEAVGASVLVVGTNFGCGSSREHAVWAIQQAGFVAVIGHKTDLPGFSDIFRQNAANCGLLLIELADPEHSHLAAHGTGARVTLDLLNQEVQVSQEKVPFDIKPDLKRQIMEGRDLIGSTLELESEIAAYERRSTAYVPSRS